MRRNKMPVSERAKQFMPFAAVTGLREALEAKERELAKVEKPQLTEEKLAELNEKTSTVSEGDNIKVTFYEDGEIIYINGLLEKKDKNFLVIDGVEVGYDDILEIS